MWLLQCDWPELAPCPALTSSRLGNIPVEEMNDVFSASVAAIQEMKMLGPGLAIPLLQYGLSVYHLDTERLAQLHPDVIITCLQTAHSCILDGELRDVALQTALGYIPKVVHCDGQDLNGIYEDMERIAKSLGAEEEGRILVERQKNRMKAAAGLCRGRGNPRVVCLQWPSPMMTSGAWVPEIIKMTGAVAFQGATGDGGVVSVEEIASSNPDVIIFAFCGLSLEVAEKTATKLLTTRLFPAIQSTNAFKRGRIAVLDGVRMMSRPGPLLLDSLESLVEILHGEAQQFGQKNLNWKLCPIH